MPRRRLLSSAVGTPSVIGLDRRIAHAAPGEIKCPDNAPVEMFNFESKDIDAR